MPPPPPPDPVPPYARSSHVLRPHHVLLCYLFLLGFHPLDENPMPQRLTLALHRFMVREVAEITAPRSFKDIVADIKHAALTAQEGPANDLVYRLEDVGSFINGPDAMSNFMQTLPIIYQDREDEETARFNRRSLFGYFCHRCFVSFAKLSIGGVEKLFQAFAAWLRSEDDPRLYAQVRRDIITNDYQLFKTKFDKTEYAGAETYTLFMKGLTTGDSNIANDGLRRFFEQRFHAGSESGLRQHAMLNLARLHFLRRELAACRKTLEEAITAARTAGDNKTLQHCTRNDVPSLLHRLPPIERGQRPIINEVQPDMHPLEILADVKKLINVENQQPLMAAHERIVQAVGLYDHYIDVQGGQFVESEQLAQHAVQSVVWNTFGCSKLARIEEDIVTAFTEVGGYDNTRLTVTLNRAYHTARQGKYEQAITSLLDPDVWRGLNLADYNLWASEVWNILALRACRRRQQRQLKEYLIPRRPNTHTVPREYQWAKEPIGSIIRDPLYEVMLMRMCEQSQASVDQLLNALWHAEYHGRYGLYRTATILLADVGLEFGMTKWCKRILDEVMPQIMSENDLEQTAFAQYTLARCIIAAGNSSPAALAEAVPYLEEAEKAYAQLEMFAAQCDVLFLLSVVLHNVGTDMEARGDAAMRKLETATDLRERVHLEFAEPWIEDVWAIVKDVGAALASR